MGQNEIVVNLGNFYSDTNVFQRMVDYVRKDNSIGAILAVNAKGKPCAIPSYVLLGIADSGVGIRSARTIFNKVCDLAVSETKIEE